MPCRTGVLCWKATGLLDWPPHSDLIFWKGQACGMIKRFQADAWCNAVFSAGKAIGLLGLEMHTRRRNRANGVITSAERGRLHIRVVESYGNCPKYIQVLLSILSTPTMCLWPPDNILK